MPTFRWGNLGRFIGVAIFAFEGVAIVFNVRSSMEKPSKFNWVFLLASLIALVLYNFFGILSVVTFGDTIQQIALFNLPQKGLLVMIMKIS